MTDIGDALAIITEIIPYLIEFAVLGMIFELFRNMSKMMGSMGHKS